MNKTTANLKEIVFVGGNIVIAAENYTSIQIKEIVFSGKERGSRITIKNANKFTTQQCKEIAFINPGHVTFDFTE